MLTEYEAQKLMHDARRELGVTPWIVAKSTVGLLIIAGVALFGAEIGLRHDGSRGTAAAGPNSVQSPQRTSIAESRRLMEERRKRFESRRTVHALPTSTAVLIQGSQTPEVDELTLTARWSD